jgi:hypothetical protein
MAIIYSYPQIEEISGSDLLLISDDSKANGTYSTSVTQLSDYVIDQAFAIKTAPASATAAGEAGEVRFTSDYIYVCVATNTWKRAEISTWT